MTYRYVTFADRVAPRLEPHTEAVCVRRDEDGRICLTISVREETLERVTQACPLVPERDAELAEGAGIIDRALQLSR